jgi:creatinine amidohydrolase
VSDLSTRASGEGRHFLLHEITRVEAAARAPEALVVLPVAATEQHGPHLPLGTDTLIVERVARAAAERARSGWDVLVAPTLPFGSSHHHLPFGGTISMATERYYNSLIDMTTSLIVDGFRRIFLLNGHGGNHEIIQLVARDLALQYPVNIAAASYWDLGRATLMEHAPEILTSYPGHAGHFETSAIMAIRPDLVQSPLPHRDEDEVQRVAMLGGPFRAERAGFWTSIAGHTDTPHRASAELGERLLDMIEPAVAEAYLQFTRLPLEAP